MRSRSIPSVSLYIRITDEKGHRRYERVNRRNPQLAGGVYCLHFYENGKRKWAAVGTNINTALKARMEKESELLTRPVEAKPSPEVPKSFEDLRTAFIHDKKTTFTRKSETTVAIRYALSRWDALTRYIEDGHRVRDQRSERKSGDAHGLPPR